MTDPFDLRVRRRDVLRGGAGLVLAAGLAGCGVNNGAKGDTQRVVKAKIDGDLSYFNWAEYLDPALIKAFEKRYGVKVRESNFDSMQGMVAKLSGGNRYDLIFPSAEYAQRLIQGKQLLRIDRGQVPNASSLYPDLENPWYDPKNEFTVPYALYATGIIYRADKVKMTGSWADLGNPSANGRAFILDDYQEGLGAANLYNGFGLNTTEGSQLDKSKAWLESLKPRIRGFSSDSVGNVVSGNALIQHAWNGDTINARNQVKDPENIKFQQCSQGVPVRQRLLRHPGQRGASRHRPDLHELHPRNHQRRAEHQLRRLPDALHGRAGPGLREARRGRPLHQRDGGGGRQGQEVREPRRLGSARVGPGVD